MTTDVRALTALANRCEDEEPTWQLDDAIAQAALGLPPCGTAGPRPYTHSVDAAKLLMPEGWHIYELSECAGLDGRPGWLVLLIHETEGSVGAWAETEAAARCAGALNARAGVEAYSAAQEARYSGPYIRREYEAPTDEDIRF